jgi:hypothetical protein
MGMGPFRDGWTEAELLHVPVVVSMSPLGRVWAEQVCLRLASHPDARVRGNAILGFGHLARIFRSLNRSAVQPLLEAGLVDPDPVVRRQAISAAEDVEWYLGWVLRGREEMRGQAVCEP